MLLYLTMLNLILGKRGCFEKEIEDICIIYMLNENNTTFILFRVLRDAFSLHLPIARTILIK